VQDLRSPRRPPTGPVYLKNTVFFGIFHRF
jgi:hypothetical protein